MSLLNLAKDSAVYGSADMLSKLIAFITFPLLAAALSPADFGFLELAMTGVTLCGLCIGSGLNNAVQRFYWEEEEEEQFDRRIIASSGFFVQIIFGICFMVLGLISLIFLVQSSPLDGIPITVGAVIALIILTPITQWLWFIQDILRLHCMPWHFAALSLFVKALGAVLGMLVVVILHKGLSGYIFTQTAVMILAIPTGLWMVRKHIIPNIDKQRCVALLKFGYPFIFVMFAYWVFGVMDKWMLASMTSIEDVGIYSISSRFSSLVFFVSGAFSLAWSPYIMKVVAESKEKYAELSGTVLLLLLFVMLIVGGGLALFSGEIIGLIMSEQYYAAAAPLVVLCFSVIVQATTQVTAIGISVSKKTYIFVRLTWCTAAFNFVGNWVLIQHFGPLGAATATALSYLLLTVIYLFYTQRFAPIKCDWLRIAWLIMLGSVVLGVSLYYNQLHWDGMTLLYKLAFSLIMLSLGAIAIPFDKLKLPLFKDA